MARKLKTIAEWINKNTKYTATIRKSHCNTDRKPKGFRYITSKGKGRWGYLLEVKNAKGEIIYDHDSAETYRTNAEVEEWIKQGMPERGFRR